MISSRTLVALSTSMLGFAMWACSGELDRPTEDDPAETGDDAEPSDDPALTGCAGQDDPECTTNAGCRIDQVCSECACVAIPSGCSADAPCVTDADCPTNEYCDDSCVCRVGQTDCSSHPDAECANNSDCGEAVCNLEDCQCGRPPAPCTSEDECTSDSECEDAACDTTSCTCGPTCECGFDGPYCNGDAYCDGCNCQTPSGEPDPADDCYDDFGAVTCEPGMDIRATEVGCEGGIITARVLFDIMPIDPQPPESNRRILELLDGDGYGVMRMFASTASPAPGEYECMIVVPGDPMTPEFAATDVCAISEDGVFFEFALSPETAALALGPIVSVMSRSEISPFIVDESEPIAVPCG